MPKIMKMPKNRFARLMMSMVLLATLSATAQAQETTIYWPRSKRRSAGDRRPQ